MQKLEKYLICSLTSVFGAPVGIEIASFTLIFSLTTGITKNYWVQQEKEKKKHDKVLMLAESKLNSIETLVSQALIDMEISHKEYLWVWRKKINMRRWKKI